METFDSQSLGRRVNELLILSEIGDGALHGYEIALRVEERSGGFFPFSHGTLYPILHRLEKEGRIAGSWSRPGEGRARKEYAVTESGREYLEGLRRQWGILSSRLEAFLEGGGGDGAVRSGAA